METNPQKATHQQTRDYNQRLVLQTIFDRGEISRADVARLTGLTRTTVSQAVGTLLDQKLVKEIGQGASTGGKTPILLNVPPNARNLIGVDLGSDEFSGAIVDLRGQVRYRLRLPLDGRQGQDALELAYELIDALQVRVTSPLLGIGVGVPGVINPAKGSSVHWAVNLSWLDLPLRDLLQKRYQVPVYVANDSQVAALAESFFSKHRHRNLIVIKVGRGVGAGIVIDGQLWKGDHFGAGEIGHVRVVENGPRCNCGHYGCLEALVSTGAIVQRARTAAKAVRKTALRVPGKTLHDLTFDDLVAANDRDDPVARAVVLETGKYLGIAVANLVSAFNIQHLFIGDYGARFGQPLLDEVRATVQQCALNTLTENTVIELSAIGDDSVILGASALLLNYELGINALR
jgi:glucokinase-like ROK family protein